MYFPTVNRFAYFLPTPESSLGFQSEHVHSFAFCIISIHNWTPQPNRHCSECTLPHRQPAYRPVRELSLRTRRNLKSLSVPNLYRLSTEFALRWGIQWRRSCLTAGEESIFLATSISIVFRFRLHVYQQYFSNILFFCSVEKIRK